MNKSLDAEAQVRRVPYDHEQYLKYLSTWSQYSRGKKTGRHENSPFRQGIPSKLPKTSHFVKVRSKGYWRSVAKPIDMQARVDRYFDPIISGEVNYESLLAVRHELRLACPSKISPITFRKAFKSIPQDTSPGFPLSRMGFSQKRECYAIMRRMNELKRKFQYTSNVVLFPCIAGVRNQLCKFPDNKPRLTWVYPLEVTLLEAIFAIPLIEALKNCSLFAWDVQWLNGGLVELSRKFKRRRAHFGCDFSHFDASALKSYILASFDELERLMSLNKWQRNAFRTVVLYFVNTWLLYRTCAYRKDHGVPSGSYFTQIIDSLINAMVTHYATLGLAAVRGFRCVRPARFCDLFYYWNFLGDDSLIELKFNLYCRDNHLFARFCLQGGNLVVHPDKGFFNPTGEVEVQRIPDLDYEDPEFLGFSITSNRDVTIDGDRLRAQMSIPENPDVTPSDALTRLMGLAYSCGTSYQFHKLIRQEFMDIQRQYPSARISPMQKGELRAFFKYVFRCRPPETFPSYTEIVLRYRGRPTLGLPSPVK